MKKHIIILLVVLVAAVMSCKDDNLDPIQQKKIKSGTILALRGNALYNFYWGYFFLPDMQYYKQQASPETTDGTDTFEFDAEFLAEDVNSMESVDFYVTKNYTGERFLLKNVPASAFVKDATYLRPWTTVSFKLTDILTALSLDATLPIPQKTIDSIFLGSYKTGDQYKGALHISGDINLKNGKKVLASEMVAAGLFQSDQFFPAQTLDFYMDKYCPYNGTLWTSTTCALGYTNVSTGAANYYADQITVDASVADRYHISNFFGAGADFYFDLNPSTSPYDQLVSFPDQVIGTKTYKLDDAYEGTESYYDQCRKSMTIYIKSVTTSTGATAGHYSVSLTLN